MKAILSRLPALLLLAGCAAAPTPDQDQPQAAADPATPTAQTAPAAPAPVPTGPCAQPWARASQALGKPMEERAGTQGTIYSIKRVSYAEIVGDQQLLQGVKLTDPTGREPKPDTLYNIVWTPEGNSTNNAAACGVRYSAPTFFDVR